VIKSALCPATTLLESATLPFVISTEAKRSGEISVLTTSPGNVFRESVAKWTCPGVPWRELLFLFRLSRAL
jgi:hypothetical protein